MLWQLKSLTLSLIAVISICFSSAIEVRNSSLQNHKS